MAKGIPYFHHKALIKWYAAWILILFLWLLLPPGSAQATIYKWRDAQGYLHFSDSPAQNVDARPIGCQPAGPPAADSNRSQSNKPTSLHQAPDFSPFPESSLPTADYPPDNDTQPADFSGSSIFWKVESDEAETPSFLLGTMHSGDPRILATAAKVEPKLLSCRLFVMETILDTQALMTIGSSFLLTDGSDLQQLLGDTWYNRAVTAAEQRGIPEPFMRRMKPWVLMSVLGSPTIQSGQFLDLALYNRALAAGIQVKGLETTAEQLEVFDGLSMDDQIQLLKLTIKQMPGMPAMLEMLTDAYLEGNLEMINRISLQHSGNDDSNVMERFMYRLNKQRNLRMFRRLEPLLNQGGVFVAVGALHLAGSSGLVAQLRQAGFRLTSIPVLPAQQSIPGS